LKCGSEWGCRSPIPLTGAGSTRHQRGRGGVGSRTVTEGSIFEVVHIRVWWFHDIRACVAVRAVPSSSFLVCGSCSPRTQMYAECWVIHQRRGSGRALWDSGSARDLWVLYGYVIVSLVYCVLWFVVRSGSGKRSGGGATGASENAPHYFSTRAKRTACALVLVACGRRDSTHVRT